jgi:ABC-2 type transport system ATP-binding protein
MTAAMIEFSDVGARVGSTWALAGISMTVGAGEVVALAGPNGGGKSLLLAIAATLVRPDAGAVRIGGHPVGRNPTAARRLLGYVAEPVGWYPRMTVREDLEFFAGAHGLPRAGRRGLVAGALERWDLAAVAGVETGRLGRGRLRRLALARALLHDPRILLLDDPTGGLDVAGRALVAREVERHVERGGAVLFASHDPTEIGSAHRVIGLVRGRLETSATPAPLSQIDVPDGRARLSLASR